MSFLESSGKNKLTSTLATEYTGKATAMYSAPYQYNSTKYNEYGIVVVCTSSQYLTRFAITHTGKAFSYRGRWRAFPYRGRCASWCYRKKCCLLPSCNSSYLLSYRYPLLVTCTRKCTPRIFLHSSSLCDTGTPYP